MPESTYIDGEYPVTVLCLPDEDMDFVAYNLFATVTIRDDEIVGITNIYGDGESDNDSYIRRAINGTSSKAGVVDQIIKKAIWMASIQYPERPVRPRRLSMHASRR